MKPYTHAAAPPSLVVTKMNKLRTFGSTFFVLLLVAAGVLAVVEADGIASSKSECECECECECGECE